MTRLELCERFVAMHSSSVQSASAIAAFWTDMAWLVARCRELEAELSRYRAQGGLTPTYASGTHPPNLQGCTQERDHG